MDILSSRGDDIVRTRCAAARDDEFLGGAEEAACCALLARALVRMDDRAFCIAGESATFQDDAGEWCLRIMPIEAGRHLSLRSLRGYDSYLPGVNAVGAQLRVAGRPATAAFPCDHRFVVDQVRLTCGLFPEGTRHFTLDEFATAIGQDWRPMLAQVNRVDSGAAARLATARGNVPVPIRADSTLHDTLRILTAVSGRSSVQSGARGPFAIASDLSEFALGLTERRAEFGVVIAVGAISSSSAEALEDITRLSLGSITSLEALLEAALEAVKRGAGGTPQWPTILQAAIADVVQMTTAPWRPTAARMAGAALRLAACTALALGPAADGVSNPPMGLPVAGGISSPTPADAHLSPDSARVYAEVQRLEAAAEAGRASLRRRIGGSSHALPAVLSGAVFPLGSTPAAAPSEIGSPAATSLGTTTHPLLRSAVGRLFSHAFIPSGEGASGASAVVAGLGGAPTRDALATLLERRQSSLLSGFGGDDSVLSDMITDTASIRELFPSAWRSAVGEGDTPPRPEGWTAARARLGALDTAVGTARLHALRPPPDTGRTGVGCHTVPFLRADAVGEALRRAASETGVSALTHDSAFTLERVAQRLDDPLDECARLGRTHGRPAKVWLSSSGYTPSKLGGSRNAEGKASEALIPYSLHQARSDKTLALTAKIRGFNGDDRWVADLDGKGGSPAKTLQDRAKAWVETLVTADFEPATAFIDEGVFLLGGEPSHINARMEAEVDVEINMGRGGHPQSHSGYEADLLRALPRMEALMAMAYGAIDPSIVGGAAHVASRRFGLAVHDTHPTAPPLLRECSLLTLDKRLHVLRYGLQEVKRAFYDFRHSGAGLPDVCACLRNAAVLVPGLRQQNIARQQVLAQAASQIPGLVDAAVSAAIGVFGDKVAAAGRRGQPSAPGDPDSTSRKRPGKGAAAGAGTPAAAAPATAAGPRPPTPPRGGISRPDPIVTAATGPTGTNGTATLSAAELAKAKAAAQLAADKVMANQTAKPKGGATPSGDDAKGPKDRRPQPDWIVALTRGQSLASVKIPDGSIASPADAKVAFNALFLLARGDDPCVEPHPKCLPCFAAECIEGGCLAHEKGKCRKCPSKAQWEPIPPAVVTKVKNSAEPRLAARIKDG